MRVKIESGGHVNDTKVTDLDTGKEIKHVIGIDISIRIDEPVLVQLTLRDTSIDIEGEVEENE